MEKKTQKEKIKEKKEKTSLEEKPLKEKIDSFDDAEIKKMLEAGVHFGHRHSKVNPKMIPFIYGKRNDVDIIDLLETKEYLQRALDFLKEQRKKDALILFVGTKISAKNLIKELAEEINMPYINERWLGGTLTNFETFKKRFR